MTRSSHSNDSVLDMTNTGKALIIALVLVDVGFISYQLLPKGEHSDAAPDAVTTNSVTTTAVGPRVDGTHVIAGNVVPTSPSANSTGQIAAAAPSPSIPAPIATDAQTEARPQISRHKQPGHASTSVQTREPAAAKADTAQPVGRARDDLSRHGSNAVAAAMTEQLVKESSKPDPSLPMPPPMQTAPVSQDHRGSNPVGAAMTQELVRQSARVTPAPQAPAQTGTQ
ncbi:hypothetical protein CJU94_31745 [Paraburkholderia aromaticivorans]|uniref:Extensin n=2 Tax=Paraburkholderia aromaticivorans TaxID=2026199 RepID=A0A248VVJ9_9BURK|nr:hypothetical protein [Paraburkholderia aromaticivorans]ASW03038.1 hypothetical protein CJU94_31745 [Paraburkholderia aromaticivorans]